MKFKIDATTQREVRESRKNYQDIDINHPNKWVRRVIAKKTADEEILKNYALNDSSAKVRKEAIRKITDEDFLSQVVLGEKDNNVKRLALRKIGSPDILAHIAQTDSNWNIRVLLFDNIKDEKTLTEIAENDSHPSLRQMALSKLDDEGLFENRALNDASPKVRILAVNKLTNEEILNDIALNDSDRDVRIEAISNPHLKNEETFKKIVLTDESKNIKEACVERIDNEETLSEIANWDGFLDVANSACAKIRTDEVLLKVARNSMWQRTCEMAASKIKDEGILLEMLKNDEFTPIVINIIEDESALKYIIDKGFPNSAKLHAMDKLNAPCPLTQEELFDQIIEGDSITASIASRKFYTSHILLDFWDGNPSYTTRKRVINRLTNDNLLFKIVFKEENQHQIIRAISKITDEDMLRKIIYDSDNPRVRQAVLEIKNHRPDYQHIESFWRHDIDYAHEKYLDIMRHDLYHAHEKYLDVMRHEGFGKLDELIHSGASMIVLDSNFILEDGEEKKYLNGIRLDIEGLVIDGNGHTIDARGKARIFDVVGFGTHLNDIIFKNGYGENGGAIINDSMLNINKCVFKSNHANVGGAIYNSRKVIVSKSDFISNEAANGGAIHNCREYKVRCHHSSFKDNTTESLGGAINNDGDLKVNNCNFESNHAEKGGAIFTNKREYRIIRGTRCLRTVCDLIEDKCNFKDNEVDDVFKNE